MKAPRQDHGAYFSPPDLPQQVCKRWHCYAALSIADGAMVKGMVQFFATQGRRNVKHPLVTEQGPRLSRRQGSWMHEKPFDTAISIGVSSQQKTPSKKLILKQNL